MGLVQETASKIPDGGSIINMSSVASSIKVSVVT